MKKVAVITFWSFVAQGHAKQLRELLGDDVEISCFSFDVHEIKEMMDADVVVISLYSIYIAIKKYIPSTTKVVIVNLTLNTRQCNQIREIPRGEKVMVVNYSSDTAMETIALFNQLGIDHVEYVPFYPGIQFVPNVNIAVTPGESHLVPASVHKVIDINHRVLDTNTIADVVIKLGMEPLLYSEKFIETSENLMSYSAGVKLLLGKTNTLQSEFISLLNVLEQGIIAVDDKLIITALNSKAENIIGTKRDEMIGLKSSKIIPQIQFEKVISSAKRIKAMLIKINGQDISTTIVPVITVKKVSGAIAIINKFTEEEKNQHKLRTQLLGKGHKAKYKFEHIVGTSKKIEELKTIAMRMANSDSSVLISGESGTGKELFAQAIHNSSRRKEYQFVAINCAALPESLLESELFGYEEGAFTGARKGGKIGLFELAHNGTLFLDEIGEMALSLQSRLLRIIQEREVMRLGSDRVIKINIRLISASNRDLKQLVAEGKFRNDLFYRLNVLPLRMVPLRERKQDIEVLIKSIRQELNVNFEFTVEAMKFINQYPWYGNVRELRNNLEYLVHLDKSVIDVGDIPFIIEGVARSDSQRNMVDGNDEPFMNHLKNKEKEFLFILKCLEHSYKKRHRIGRRSLVKLADTQDIYLSENDVRKILEELQAHDLVKLSNGRGGTQITEQGLQFIKNIDCI